MARDTEPAMNSQERREVLTRCRGDSSATAIAQTVINILNLFAAPANTSKLPLCSLPLVSTRLKYCCGVVVGAFVGICECGVAFGVN